MSFLADRTKDLIDLGKTIKTKTQEYSTIAKLALDIKKFENEIERNHIGIGKYIIEKIDNDENMLDLKDEKISNHAKKIKELEESIKKKRDEIKEQKRKAASAD